ncbi:MAG: FtsB family cell division protein [bacterium]
MAGIHRLSFQVVARKLEQLLYLIAILYVGIVLVVGVSGKTLAFAASRMEVSRLNRELAARQANIEALNLHIRDAQNPEYVERIAREELGMSRPGEIQYKKVDPEGNRAGRNRASSIASPGTKSRTSVLAGAWNALKKLFGR